MALGQHFVLRMAQQNLPVSILTIGEHRLPICPLKRGTVSPPIDLVLVQTNSRASTSWLPYQTFSVELSIPQSPTWTKLTLLSARDIIFPYAIENHNFLLIRDWLQKQSIDI